MKQAGARNGGGGESRVLFVMVLAGLGLVQVRAQVPSQVGQWAGPYEQGVEEGGTFAFPMTREIAHLAVLPPSTSYPGTYEQRALISCVNGGGAWPASHPTMPCQLNTTGHKYGRTYRYSVDRNSVAPIEPPASIPQPPNPGAGTVDFFCGGHGFIDDGKLFWASGTDYASGKYPNPLNPSQCIALIFGHDRAYTLDPLAPILEWTDAGLQPLKRWYPTVVFAPDPSRAEVFGHTWNISPLDSQQLSRDQFDVGLSSWVNKANLSQAGGCTDTTVYQIWDYPRMHVIRAGYVVHVNAVAHDGSTDPDGWINAKTRFLDVRTPACPGEPRWLEGLSAQSMPAQVRLHGSSVHLITWNGGGSFSETIYQIGGSTVGVEGGGCDCFPSPLLDNTADKYLASVEKMVLDDVNNPEQAIWQDAGPDLNATRTNHNTVILADGSLGVFGGTSVEGSVPFHACVDRKNVERLRPVEVFGDPNATWEV